MSERGGGLKVGPATLLLTFGLAAAALGQPLPAPPAAPLDPAAYAAALHELAERVRLADTGSLAEIAREVPAVWRVEVEGQAIDVPGIWLQQKLREASKSPEAWPPVRAGILEAIAAAERDARALVTTAGLTQQSNARASLDEVLARPEFAQIGRDGATARLLARITELFRRWWTRLGGDRLPVRSTATVFAWAASLAALVLLAGWTIHLLRRSNRVAAGTGEPLNAPTIPAEVWARRAAAAADARESARCAYRAVVSRIEEDGTWRADAARTPREYITLLPGDHRRRPVVEEVARRFEEIWFGGRAATEDDRGAVLRRLRELGCLPAE